MFDNFCCVNYAMKTFDMTKAKNISDIVSPTSHCFEGLHLTEEEMFIHIIHFFRNKSFPFKEEDCFEDPCEQPMTSSSIAYFAFWVIVMFITVTSNLLVIIAVQKTPALKQNITNWFISSLALSDLLVGAFLIPIKIHVAYHNLYFCAGQKVCLFHMNTINAFFRCIDHKSLLRNDGSIHSITAPVQIPKLDDVTSQQNSDRRDLDVWNSLGLSNQRQLG